VSFDRILLCTDAPKGQGLAYYYYRAFCDVVGAEKVRIVDEGNRNYDSLIIERGIRRVHRELGILSKQRHSRLAAELSPAKNIVILFNNADLDEKAIKDLSDNQSVYLVNYLSDSPYGIVEPSQKSVLNTIPLFDLVCTFAVDLVPVLYQLGAKRVERIPFGYCKYTHLEPSQNIAIELPQKVYYFGTWSKEIESWVNELTQFDFEIEGNGWGNSSYKKLREAGTKQKPKTDHNMAITARKAGVVVNFTRARHGCFHTMKTFELMIAGACVVSNYSKEQEEFFPGDHVIGYFNTSSELIEKVKYYLNNARDTEIIREHAKKYALPHSYHDRVSILISLITNLTIAS